MSTVVMNRCDDRLIHGQVVTFWVQLRQANSIWIVDDVVAGTPMMLDIFRFAAPTGIKMEAMTVDTAAEKLQNLDPNGSEKVFLIVKFPKTFLRLWDKGYHPKDVNYGAMAKKPTSKTVANNCDLSVEEMEDTEKLFKLGVDVWIQLVPMGNNKVVKWAEARSKFGYK